MGSHPDEKAAKDGPYNYQRRRSRAVLYQLSGSYNRQKNSKSKLQLRKVSAIHIYIFMQTSGADINRPLTNAFYSYRRFLQTTAHPLFKQPSYGVFSHSINTKLRLYNIHIYVYEYIHTYTYCCGFLPK